FRKLVRYDDDGNTRFEAHQHGLGNEIGDESQPKKRRGDENHPDKQRQRRVRRERDRSIDARDIGQRRRRQNGQRRRRADTERAFSTHPSGAAANWFQSWQASSDLNPEVRRTHVEVRRDVTPTQPSASSRRWGPWPPTVFAGEAERPPVRETERACGCEVLR